MSRRLELQTIFEDILGSRNVYFQPPESKKMDYPAIVYSRASFDTRHANNQVYIGKTRYTVTVIDKNPDSDIPSKILQLPLTFSNRAYRSDNLNHDVFTIYY